VIVSDINPSPTPLGKRLSLKSGYEEWVQSANPDINPSPTPLGKTCAIFVGRTGSPVLRRSHNTPSGSSLSSSSLRGMTTTTVTAFLALNKARKSPASPARRACVDADRSGCLGRAAGHPRSPRVARGSSVFVEFGPFLGQTRARGGCLASVREDLQRGGADMDSDAERAEWPLAARVELSNVNVDS